MFNVNDLLTIWDLTDTINISKSSVNLLCFWHAKTSKCNVDIYETMIYDYKRYETHHYWRQDFDLGLQPKRADQSSIMQKMDKERKSYTKVTQNSY